METLKGFLTADGIQHFVWMALFSLGALPFLALRGLAAVPARAGGHPPAVKRLFGGALVAVAAHVGTALMGGPDVHRFLFSAAPFVILLALYGPLTRPGLVLDVVLALGASMLIWRPFQVMNGTYSQYLEFWSPVYISAGALHHRLVSDLRLFLPAVVVMVASSVLQNRLMRVPAP